MPRPIFRLVRQIQNDDIGLRTMRLVTKLGVETVEDLAFYSVSYLRSQTSYPDDVVYTLAEIMEKQYHLKFSETYRTP